MKQDRIFNPHMTCIQMNTNQNDKQEDRVLDQQNMGLDGDRNVTNVRQGKYSRCEATKNEFTQYIR